MLDHDAPMRDSASSSVEKIDLGEAWTTMTGLPFVYAFWAGRPDALNADDVRGAAAARATQASPQPTPIAREYFPRLAGRQAVGARVPAG